MATDTVSYPIQVELDYPQHQSRLVTFFRYLLAIPHFIVMLVLLIIAYVAVPISFLAVLITGRYPHGLYSFVSGTLRYVVRVQGYVFLLTARYPPFSLSEDPNYPIRVHFERPERIARWHVLNGILAIPMAIIFYAIGLVANIVSFFAWVAALIIGRNPEALWDVGAVYVRWQARLSGYILFLTEKYPPLTWG